MFLSAGRGRCMDAEFRAFCARLGNDADIVQGAGGNVSVKDGDWLRVKASGTWLRDAESGEIFVTVSRLEALGRHRRGEENLAGLAPPGGGRPSIETGMHALIPKKFVVHVHCVDSIAQSAHAQAETRLPGLLKSFRHALIAPARPGLPLARAVERALEKDPRTELFVLCNHGLAVGADSLADAGELLAAARRALALPAREPVPASPSLGRLNDLGWVMPESAYAHSLAADPQTLRLACRAPLYPDHVVFLGPVLPLARQGERLGAAVRRVEEGTGLRPQWMILPGGGVLADPRCGAGALAMLDALGRVGQRLTRDFEPVRALPADLARQLGKWEAEAYRKRFENMSSKRK